MTLPLSSLKITVNHHSKSLLQSVPLLPGFALLALFGLFVLLALFVLLGLLLLVLPVPMSLLLLQLPLLLLLPLPVLLVLGYHFQVVQQFPLALLLDVADGRFPVLHHHVFFLLLQMLGLDIGEVSLASFDFEGVEQHEVNE